MKKNYTDIKQDVYNGYQFSILPRNFFESDTVVVAKKLLGKKLIRKIGTKYLVGIINETEAYRSDDPASHCYQEKITNRNRSMFGPVGSAYVYISYGIHFCFNVVARNISNFKAGGVLIRSVVPISEFYIIKKNRGFKKVNELIHLTNGPAKLTQAFSISLEHNGLDLTNSESDLFLADGSEDNFIVESSPRIGISRAKDKLWRFYISY